MKLLLLVVTLVAASSAGRVAIPVHQSGAYVALEPEAPPQPYSFGYVAGRAPGHVDRVHSETKDAAGVVRGEFSYVDPRNNVQTVQYVADANGFHPIVNGVAGPVAIPKDTPVVAAAKQRHLVLKERIAADHARIGAEHARLQAEQAALVTPEQALQTGAYVPEPKSLEYAGPPQPYSFSYEAGRYPGHIDRAHSEEKDAAGVVRGEYSYVDPRYKVRTVQYTADSSGFHATLNNPVTDTPAVEAARMRHLVLKQRILSEHARLAAISPPLQNLISPAY